MPSRYLRAGGAAAALLTLAYSAPSLLGQATAATDDAVALPAFGVSTERDVGYQSNNSNTATLVNEQLRDLPLNVVVFNEEFIRDIGAVDTIDVLNFATSVEPQGIDQGNSLQREFVMRGLTTRFALRNNFVWYQPSDAFATSRVELIRGPNALLYGNAEPGGVANTITKQAAFNHVSADLQVRVSDWDELRIVPEFNYGNDRFAMLAAVVSHDAGSWRENDKRDTTGAYANLRFKPWSGTVIKLEGESVERNDTLPGGILRFSGTFEGQTYESAQLLFGRANGNDITGGLVTKENSQAWSGADRRLARDWYNWTASLEHRFTDRIVFEAAYNVQQQDTAEDKVTGLTLLAPDDPLNPFTGNWAIEAQRFDTTFSFNTVRNLRATLVADFDLGPTLHRAVAGFYREEDTFDIRDSGWFDANLPAADANREPTQFFRLADGPEWTFAPAPAGFTFRDKPGGFTRTTDRELESLYISFVSRFFDSRLRTLAGIRRDDIYRVMTENRGFGDPTGAIVEDETADSINLGFVFAVTPELGVFANYSESFKPNQSVAVEYPTGFGFGPQIGSGYEYGIKYDLPDGRLSGTLSYYTIDFENQATAIGGPLNQFVNNNSRLRTATGARQGREFLGNQYAVDQTSEGVELQLTANLTRNWTLSFGAAYIEARQAKDVFLPIAFNDDYLKDAQGFPVDVNGARLQIADGNGGTRDVTPADFRFGNSTYLVDIVNAGTPMAGALSTPNNLRLVGSGNLALDTNPITGQQGIYQVSKSGELLPNGQGRKQFNLVTRYNFTTGVLKGWHLGGSVRYRSDIVLAYEGTFPDRVEIKGEDYAIFGLIIGYRRNFDRVRWSTQLNVNNLFGDDTLLGEENDYRYQQERQILWTNTFSF